MRAHGKKYRKAAESREISSSYQPKQALEIIKTKAFAKFDPYKVARFGKRDVWKIGWAADVAKRLNNVNKHVPHEVLRERWEFGLQQGWASAGEANAMEQKVLKMLRTGLAAGERVRCTRAALGKAWAAALSVEG